MAFWDLFKKPAESAIPALYPKLSEAELVGFLSEAEFKRLRQLRRFLVLPLVSREISGEDRMLGMGLSELLIRDLMLLHDVSIRGPEDTPKLPHEHVMGHFDSVLRGNDGLFTGRTTTDGKSIAVDLELWTADGLHAERTVNASDVAGLTQDLAAAAAEMLGANVSPETRRRWTFGRPRQLQTLREFGRLSVEEDPAQSRGALELLQVEPQFVLPAHVVDSTMGALKVQLRARELDPFDAQLHFQLYCTMDKGRGKDLVAFQYLRRAIELSPGHGKAHMCAPHRSWREKLLNHSELGMYLLPANNFAISNYNSYLHAAGASHEKLLEMALFGLEHDESDPWLYHQAIHAFEKLGRGAEALDYARQLCALFGPPANARAIQCLEQNPETKRRLRSGEYNPLKEARALVARLERSGSR